MADIAFYHLVASTQDDALPILLNKTLAAGKKAVVMCNPKGMQNLSSVVWSYGETLSERGGGGDGEGSWLAHGLAGKDDDDAALCPIWFSGDTGQNLNNAEYGFFLDGHDPASAQTFERVFILFNGLDDSAVTVARDQWRALKEQGHELSYWAQDDGGAWQKK